MLGKCWKVYSRARLSFPHTGWLVWPMHFLILPSLHCSSVPLALETSQLLPVHKAALSIRVPMLVGRSRDHWASLRYVPSAGSPSPQIDSLPRQASSSDTHSFQVSHLPRHASSLSMPPTPEMSPSQAGPLPRLQKNAEALIFFSCVTGKGLVDPGKPRCSITWCW